LICQVAGIEPRITWEVLTEDERYSAFSSDDETEAREVFEYYLASNMPGYRLWSSYHVGTWEHYLPVSQDDAAAITHLLPMCIQPEENFLCISLTGPEADGGWGATLGYNPLGFSLGATADSLAMAMCKAFLLFKLPIE
jgi:hypothetical protein